MQHQLRAHTPNDAKALKQTVATFPKSHYDLAETLQQQLAGEAIVTVMDPDGAPDARGLDSNAGAGVADGADAGGGAATGDRSIGVDGGTGGRSIATQRTRSWLGNCRREPRRPSESDWRRRLRLARPLKPRSARGLRLKLNVRPGRVRGPGRAAASAKRSQWWSRSLIRVLSSSSHELPGQRSSAASLGLRGGGVSRRNERARAPLALCTRCTTRAERRQ